MPARRPLLLAVAAATFSLPTAAGAFNPVLSASQVQEAYRQGQEMAGSRTHGYSLADWVLWDQPDPMVIAPDEGLVEAVIVRTPFENLRYTSYLDAWSDQPFSADDAQQLAKGSADILRFLTYGHSESGSISVPEFVNEEPGQEGRNFLDYFRDARLTLADGTTLEPKETEVFGPAQDFYRLEAGGNELRWLGYKSFAFDLSGLGESEEALAGLKGTFSFTDSANQPHSYDFDLSRFQ